jgi:hypothetical protein
MRTVTCSALALVTGLSMLISVPTARSQALNSARGIAFGAYTASTSDVRSLDWNPAGLHFVRNWELALTNDISTQRGQSGLSIQSIGVARQVADGQVAAFSYSPDKVLDIVVPASLTITEQSGASVIARFDRQISYHQRYTLGYSIDAGKRISVGAAVRLFETSIGDTKYSLDSNNIVTSSVTEYTTKSWAGTLGALLDAGEGWTVGASWKNFTVLHTGGVAEAISHYDLRLSSPFVCGIGYEPNGPVRLGAEADSWKQFRFGGEWNPLTPLRFRAGFYCSTDDGLMLDAAACGAGFTWRTVGLDLSYVRFRRSDSRSGAISVDEFENAKFQDVDYTPFASDRLTISGSISLGLARTPDVQIEYVEMLGEIFPAMSPLYAVQPVAKARVQNIAAVPVQVRLGFSVNGLMDGPTESALVSLAPGEERDVPLTAVFSADIDSIRKLAVREGSVSVRLADGSEDAGSQTKVIIRGRNDWNGDITRLKYFVTPQAAEIVGFTRRVIGEHRSLLDSVPAPLQQMAKAGCLFDDMTRSLVYVNDPKESQEYVQYPVETLTMRGGDCDDFSVTYASLLRSIGVDAAFVEVMPPGHREDSHVYILFDSGVRAADAAIISSNPKKYVLRKNEFGNTTAWIPVETTILKEGFNAAWAAASERFYHDTEIQQGLLDGWVRVEDIGNLY